MNFCGATRLLVPAFLVGVAVATLLGNDLYGWLAAWVALGILITVQRVRGTGPACAISLPADADPSDEAEQRDAVHPDRPLS